jgi:hypothetical protein
MIKNKANQNVHFRLFSTTDGAAVTSGTTTVYVIGDASAETTGAGTITHVGHGVWRYVPPQAETNYDVVTYTAINSGAMVAWEKYDTTVPTRIEEQVASVPVAVIPAPPLDTQTTAWCYCYDQHGALAIGVTVKVWLRRSTGTSGAYSREIASGVSNSQGIASCILPKGAFLEFEAARADGSRVRFTGTASSTLQMPTMIG